MQPTRSQWFLDAGRAAPKLAVSRRQFQLAPGFAITAHAAQGQNLLAAIADFGGDKWTFYIAITRVLSRKGLGIYRPFPLAPFTQQPTLGRSLLLRVWRGERIDWARFRDEHLQERPCSECAERKPQKAFSMAQWRRPETDRVCKECLRNRADAGTPWQCWGPPDAFPGEKQKNRRNTCARVCLNCKQQKLCSKCKRKLSEEAFSAAAWKRRNPERLICHECAQALKRGWTCILCAQKKPRVDFLRHVRTSTHGRLRRTARCNACLRKQDTAERARAAARRLRRSRARLRKKQRIERATCAVPVPARQAKLHVYVCPHCKQNVQSDVVTGRVVHRFACGNRFQVRAGVVFQQTHPHACPHCETTVYSAQPSGRIRSSHKMPNGRSCPQHSWQAHANHSPNRNQDAERKRARN